MLNQELDRLAKFISENMIDFHQQENIEWEGSRWCVDMWLEETCVAMQMSEAEYLAKPSKYLENSHAAHKNQIRAYVTYKRGMIKLLEEHKDYSDTLLVCEVGPGMDIVLANSIKKWKKIICYDSNNLMIERLQRYFTDENLETHVVSTHSFPFLNIDRPVILVANVTRLADRYRDVLDNKNIFAIVNGEVLRG